MKRIYILIFLATWVFTFVIIFSFTKITQFGDLSHQTNGFIATDFLSPHQKILYKFTNPSLAYKVLTKLDIPKFPPIKKNATGLGLIHDSEYCNLHRAYITEHPETIFAEMNFVANTLQDSLVRGKIMPSLGKDIHPEVGPHMTAEEKKSPKSPLRLDANLFYFSNGLFNGMTTDRHFSCLSQISNHIPGHDNLISKDLVAKAASDYAKKFKGRPQCFNYGKVFPKTWILYEKEDCTAFFKALNSPKYKQLKKERGIVYIGKIARYAHRAEGVTPIQEDEEKRIRTLYKNGEKCGQVQDQYIVQNFIHNTLLYNGHRFDFRIYMFIASTNPLIAYYHDGIVRFTLSAYDTSSNDKKVLLPNAAVNDDIYSMVKEGGKYEGMDEEQLRRAHRKSYEELQDYLLEKGYIKDTNWLDEHLRPEVKKAMVNLLRMTGGSFQKHSSLFELHGIDFMLDSDLNLWFIESNSSPALAKFSIPMEKFIVKMITDHFNIVYGLMRSRMKRVIKYVNELIESGEAKESEEGELIINNLEGKKEEFERISKNYFEEEFKPSEDNGFVLIVDENYEGVKRYQGIVSEECL